MSHNYLNEDCIDENLYPPSETWFRWPEYLFYNTRSPKQCRRCGKVVENTDRTFCNKECSDIYYGRIREAEETNGKSFKKWLNDSIDYSYSPEKF